MNELSRCVHTQKKISRNDNFNIIQKIADAGFKKISFVGGEPLLCPWINDLFKETKRLGMTTMLVTNGFLLEEHIYSRGIDDIDWITISIDSVQKETNRRIGRFQKNDYWGEYQYLSLIRQIHFYNKHLKINTVVSKYNLYEDFNYFISIAKPERWKVFQVLIIQNQNDEDAEDFFITNEQFTFFQRRHKVLSGITKSVFESNEEMINSYIMVNSDGRLFQNVGNIYSFSKLSLLETDFKTAFKDVKFDVTKYFKRGAKYSW